MEIRGTLWRDVGETYVVGEELGAFTCTKHPGYGVASGDRRDNSTTSKCQQQTQHREHHQT
jgi:hypothetical protein